MSYNKNKNSFALKPLALTFTSIAFLLAVSLCGCQKFLDVKPKDKVPQSLLLVDEQGFKDALIGAYLGMDKSTTAKTFFGLYTSDLSMGLMSTLGYDYDNATAPSAGTNGTFFNSAVYYNYTDLLVKPELDAIWGDMYTNISNVNNIIAQMKGKESLFSGDNYDRIKGEAIGLRALFHFDLARMYGQSPAKGMSAPAIPYIRNYGITATSFVTLSNALDSCIDDLIVAKDLLANTDTSAVLKAVDDPFKSFTQNHLNYWAVQALMARVYLYKGDMVNAGKYANAVIGSGKFPLITSNVALGSNAVRDRLFSRELVFSVYSSNIKNYNTNLFNKTSGTPLRVMPSPGNKAIIYTKGSGSTSDYRYISWFDNNVASPAAEVPSKYFQDANLPYELQNIVPVVRMSELYYIAAEVANASGSISTGVSYLNNVRQARGLTALNASGITSTDSLSNEIMAEYRKEFVAEGQTYFYFKRLNKDIKQATGTTATIPAGGIYVFPIPDKENEYNH